MNGFTLSLMTEMASFAGSGRPARAARIRDGNPPDSADGPGFQVGRNFSAARQAPRRRRMALGTGVEYIAELGQGRAFARAEGTVEDR